MKNCLVKIVIFTAIMLSSCNKGKVSENPVKERVISVKAEIVDLHDVEIVRSYTGTLEGEKQAEIYAKIAEAVLKVNVYEGQVVDEDMVLINLDKTGPSSNYQQAYSRFKNAEKNFKKMEYLYQEGAVSESQFDAARTEYEVNKAVFEAAAQLVEIRSPIAGQVTSLNVSSGDFVQVGQKLVTIANTSRLRVKFEVNSSDIVYFHEGTEVVITSDVVLRKAHGKVVAVASSASPVTRSFEVEALVDNKDGYFKPGMFVRIQFIQQNLSRVISIPRQAVLTLDNQRVAFVVKNGVVEKRKVTLGPEVNGELVIFTGLEVGDTLVTLGQDYLDDQYKVNITTLNERDQ